MASRKHIVEIALSTGSACASGAVASSPVLRAIGLSDRQADRTLRLGLGRFTTAEEIRRAGARLIECFRRFGNR